MRRRYAEGTEVTSDRSKAEIEKILTRYGADSFAYMSDPKRAAVAFRAANRNVRFILPMPSIAEVSKTPKGRKRRDTVADQELAQEIRRRWRALALSIKAKLETVESGIAEFETEFMPYIMMPNGKTVAENVGPQIATAYDTGKMPKLLEALS
jgi:hypothetical protein